MATKERLAAADPKSADLFRPYLRGQDVSRWLPEWAGLWMLVLKSSGNHPWPWARTGRRAEAVFAATYPAIHAHMKQYQDSLMKRQDQGEHWWELRACAYWKEFERDKICIQMIAYHSRVALDIEHYYLNNAAVILPTKDTWILAVLNSPAVWYLASRTFPHKKDEALAMDTPYVQELPIPSPDGKTRSEANIAVETLHRSARMSYEGTREILERLKADFGVEKPSQKLQDVAALDADALTAEVQKLRGKRKPLTAAEAKALRDEHARSVRPLQALAAEARRLERRVADLVNAAYGLTPEEVALMWRTAPPRMPGEPPGE